MELTVDNVSHQFDKLTVLEQINFSVRENETVVVIGPSGCGKSTLLNIIGGLTQPTSGQVLLQGDVHTSLNPLTFVFQDFALLPWRSVANNVKLVLEHHKLTAAECRERVAACLARTGLSEFADTYPVQLSGGMRQRVGIARALAVDPAVLLMDEPLSALDAQTRELLMDDFIDLWEQQSTTTIYVTHSLEEALAVADRVLVLSRRPGRLIEDLQIDIPKKERRRPEAAAAVAVWHSRLWDLIRSEAQIADREISSA